MGQTSSGLNSSTLRNTNAQCLSCENPDCYEEVEEVTLPDRSRSLNDLAEKFESILEKARYYPIICQSLGLEELIGPIKETALTLKNLGDRNVPTTSQPRVPCNCNEWGPDDVDSRGEWICNACGDKCQCDKTWYIPSVIKKKSSKTDPEVNEIGPMCMGKCELHSLDCPCGCQYLKEKRFNVKTVTSIDTIRDQRKENNVEHEIIVAIQAELSDDLNPSVPSKLPVKIIQGDEQTEDFKNSGVVCPCGCGYYQQGEFKICPCGCGTIIEIVDDGETSELKSGGPCCVCGNELNDELNHYPEELSQLSLEDKDVGLITAVEMLRNKCRIKDGMIAILAEELRNSGNVDHIVGNLTAPCLPRIAIDFDRSMLYEYLKSTSLPELSKGGNLVEDDTVPKPMNFRVVRSILNSLFLAWDPPELLCNIRGYEIQVNGIVTSRVGSATRSQAILTSLDLTKPTVLTLYAVATNGHISDSSTITFPSTFEHETTNAKNH